MRHQFLLPSEQNPAIDAISAFVAVEITDAPLNTERLRHDDPAPPKVKVHLALGFVDMRKGIDGLAMLVQGVSQQDSVHRRPRSPASRPAA